jgi:drug/metabolite transporter (DMT)-like permease
MSEITKHNWRAEAALLFTILVWGLNFPVVKAVLQFMHPHVLNALRFVVSAVVLGGFYVHHRRRLGLPLWQPLREHFVVIGSLGILGFVFYQLCFIIGLDHTTAGNAALIMASSPLWTAVVGRAFGTEHLQGASWFALFIVLIGTCVVVVGGSSGFDLSSQTFVGNLIMIAAAFFWGAYTAFSRPVLGYLSATGLTFLSLLFALPFLFGIAIPYYPETDWGQIRLIHWAAILFSGGLSTGLAITVWNTAISTVGASNTAVYGNLVPLVAVGFSYLLLGETIYAAQIAGGALVIGGVLVMRRARLLTVQSP